MILKGSVFFGVDLARALMRNTTLGFLSASSYGERTQSTGRVEIDASHLGDIEEQNVLLIDDILDTGHTFSKTLELLREKRPASLKTCVLMDKPARREVEVQADHVGFYDRKSFRGRVWPGLRGGVPHPAGHSYLCARMNPSRRKSHEAGAQSPFPSFPSYLKRKRWSSHS